MKKLFLITLLPIISSCTFTRQQKAEKLVKNYLDSTLNDPGSYQPIRTKIDTFWTNALSNSEYKTLWDTSFSISSKLKQLRDDITFDGRGKRVFNNKKIKMLMDDSIKIETQMKAIGDTIKNKPNGWLINQEYRAKNGFGALGIHSISIHSNEDFSKVIGD